MLVLLMSLLTGCLEDSSVKDSNNNEDNPNGNYVGDFVFTLLNGKEKNIKDYKGRIVLLDFMGANCGPCQKMMLVLKQLYDEYLDELEIISIDVWIVLGETSETLQQLINLFKQEGIDLDWTFGVDDKGGTLYNKYASGGVPLIHILDENGNIYYTKNGYLDGYTDYLMLSEKIDELL